MREKNASEKEYYIKMALGGILWFISSFLFDGFWNVIDGDVLEIKVVALKLRYLLVI